MKGADVLRRVAILLASVTLLSVLLFSCDRNKSDINDMPQYTAPTAQAMDLSAVDISRYVALGEYRDMVITLASSEDKRSDAVWKRVVENATVTEYPEQQVEYYLAQSRAKYEYIAKNRNDTYENVISLLGVTEADMLNEARALVREDLVFFALLKAESVTLSEEEKNNNFDRYVNKFVVDYGYTEAYVRERMQSQICDAMLFDKMLERLILINKFVVSQGE